MLTKTLALSTLIVAPVFAASPKEMNLWPDMAPGEKGDIKEEVDTTKDTDNKVAGRRLIRLGNVSKPTMTIMRPPADKDTGASVVIFPGGGYHILAWDLEGTEVAEWLNKNGVTGIVVKYRVPKRVNLENFVPPLQDAQRAMGLVRANAKDWGLDPERVGILGFSAGGNLAAVLTAHTETRTYPRVDAADDLSCAPNFSFLIYPAYLTLKDKSHAINPNVAITPKHPKTFIAMSQDDGVGPENAVHYYLELMKNKVPSELHLYPTGGHGYGLRPNKDAVVTTWPDRAIDWMNSNGWLVKR